MLRHAKTQILSEGELHDWWINLTLKMLSWTFLRTFASFLACEAIWGLRTTKANGSSPENSSGIPMTAASATFSCPKRWPSSSAGATWKPLTLINSYTRFHQLRTANISLRYLDSVDDEEISVFVEADLEDSIVWILFVARYGKWVPHRLYASI